MPPSPDAAADTSRGPDAALGPGKRGIDRLLAVMARLRDPERGCPWDLAQRFETIVPHTIEEAYEVAEAIETGAPDAALKDELGDLLFQVVFYAQLAAEERRFDFDAIADAHADKMIGRHPHVFGAESPAGAHEVTGIWETRKAEERAAKARGAGLASASILDGITAGLPAATHALKLQKRAARVGFDWPSAEPVFDKLDEEVNEIKDVMAEADATSEARHAALEDEVGDALFALVNLARHLGVDPETALRRTNRKFERRFRNVEQAIESEGKTLESASLDEMEAHWRQAKRSD